MTLDKALENESILESENRVLKKQVKAQEAQLARLNESVDFLTTADQFTADYDGWMVDSTGAGSNVGIANLFLSDLHLDEVIKKDQVEGCNAYNRRIAEQRLERTVNGFITLSRDYLNGVDYEGACIPLGGDIFSGTIHEELKETNEVPILDSLEYWIGPMSDAIATVADEFGRVHLPCVVGNHGRQSRKPIAKNRVRDNYEWLFYRNLARTFAEDERITFQISEAADCQYQQYGYTFRLTHGDQFRGGDGITGSLVPVVKGDLKKRRRQVGLGRPYDYLLLGHWHFYSHMGNVIQNGSMKGMDEYAMLGNFDFQVPIQAMWITTPEHGCTFSAPVFSMDKKKERWP